MNKELVKGETYNIYYEFDAPDVSPYLFTLGALEIGNFKEIRQWQIASDATATYYFNANDNNEKWTHDERMVDGNTGTYASASADGKTQWLTGSTCLGTELGTISKVEIRAYGYLEAAGASVSLRPVFNAGDGTDHTAITATTAGWGSYIDITTDNNASSPWTWSDVLNLDCDVEFNEEHGGNKGHVAKVEIRVTYADDNTVTYYFDDWNTGEEWKHFPGQMVDNILTTYAYSKTDLGTEGLTSNTCPGTDLGTISKVEIRAYGYVLGAEAGVTLRPVFTNGDGGDHNAGLPSEADPGAWGSYSDITTDNNAPSPWTWSDVSSLDCDIVCHHPHTPRHYSHVAKVEIRVTYPTWVSDRESYDSDYHTVTMTGEGFKTDYDYKVAYYDGAGAKVQTEFTNSSSDTGALESKYNFRQNSGATYGDWHSVVLDTTGSAPDTYAAAIADPNYVIEDGFYVAQSAIPEFPTVIAGFAVCMLCAIPYMVMRRSGGKR